MKLFATEIEINELEAQLSSSTTSLLTVLLFAWYNRQRDAARSLELANKIEIELASIHAENTALTASETRCAAARLGLGRGAGLWHHAVVVAAAAISPRGWGARAAVVGCRRPGQGRRRRPRGPAPALLFLGCGASCFGEVLRGLVRADTVGCGVGRAGTGAFQVLFEGRLGVSRGRGQWPGSVAGVSGERRHGPHAHARGRVRLCRRARLAPCARARGAPGLGAVDGPCGAQGLRRVQVRERESV